tara:strand:+ start:7165 stop:7446 length:282 start_codon:yes stop_codon:yes gene_type:complete
MKSYTFLTTITILLVSMLCLFILYAGSKKVQQTISMCFDPKNNLVFLGYSKQIPKFKEKIVKEKFEIRCVESSMTVKDWNLLRNAKNKDLIFK